VQADTKSGNPFKTDHLYLGAFLICRGHALAGTEPCANGRISFLFPGSDEVRSAAGEFLSGGLVDARQFSFCVLQLKKILAQHTLRKVGTVEYAKARKQS